MSLGDLRAGLLACRWLGRATDSQACTAEPSVACLLVLVCLAPLMSWQSVLEPCKPRVHPAPVPLLPAAINSTGTELRVVGWGAISEGDTPSSFPRQLQEGTLPLVDPAA